MKAYPRTSDKRNVSPSQTMVILLSAACLAALLLAWSLAHGARPWASPAAAPVGTGPALEGGNFALEQTRAGNGFLQVMPNETLVTRSTAVIDASGVGLLEYLPGEVPTRQEPAPSYGVQP